MELRSGFPFNYDQEQASVESGLHCRDKSRALQSQAQDADINVIVKRFGVTGQLPQGLRLPTYGDFSEVVDYRTALDAVRAAEASFMEVPAEIRRRFGDDPQAFVEFCSDEKNYDELVKLGLAKARLDPDASIREEVAREVKKEEIREASGKKRTKSEGTS